MVDGSTFSPADSDTKKAKGMTQRHTVKYASTLMPNRKKGQHMKQLYESRNARKTTTKNWTIYKQTAKTARKSIFNLLLRMDNTLVQSTGRPYNGLPPPTLREITRRNKGAERKNKISVKHNDRHIIQTHLLFSSLRESVIPTGPQCCTYHKRE